jgi:hypothetical protein
MRYITSFISIFCLIALPACEKEAKNVRLPEFVQKLVITSFISPSDTVSYIRVSSNSRIYGELGVHETLGNLSGWISDGEREIELTNLGEGFCFKSKDMQVEEGKTYHLLVKSDKGLLAEAECTVPYRRNFSLEIDTLIEFTPYPDIKGGFYQIFYDVYITDYQGEKNYFRSYGKEVLYDTNYYDYPYIGQIYAYKNEFFSDDGNDGRRFLANQLFSREPELADSAHVVFYLLTTDKTYYDYHISLNKYTGGETPFTEISPVYTNVSGGLGIFAAYNIDSLVMKLK